MEWVFQICNRGLKALNGEIEFKRIMPRGMMTSIVLKTKLKAPSMEKLNILIVDDHKLFREGLKLFLDKP